MKILAIIVFTFISNTFSYLTEQVSNFVPQQEKSLTKSSSAQTSSIDKINNIDINMRDIIIAVDTRQITENKNTNDNNKRSKRHRRRGGRNQDNQDEAVYYFAHERRGSSSSDESSRPRVLRVHRCRNAERLRSLQEEGRQLRSYNARMIFGFVLLSL